MIVIEEADESLYWLEVLKELNFTNGKEPIEQLIKEANELTSIFIAISKTTKINKVNHKS